MSRSISPLYNLSFSALAASIAEIITLPICTTKTKYQNTNSTSVISTTKSIYKESGIKGFYRALIPAVCGQSFSTSSKYVLYRYIESKQIPYSNRFVNGIISGILSSLITHPLDSCKIYMQMNTSIITDIKLNGMFNIVYRGYSKTFFKVILSSALFFPIYDTIREYTNDSILASFASAVISTSIMHPIDYLKTRHIYGLSLYNGLNPLTYYKGLSLNLMRIVPHFIITMSIIDILTTRYINYNIL